MLVVRVQLLRSCVCDVFQKGLGTKCSPALPSSSSRLFSLLLVLQYFSLSLFSSVVQTVARSFFWPTSSFYIREENLDFYLPTEGISSIGNLGKREILLSRSNLVKIRVSLMIFDIRVFRGRTSIFWIGGSEIKIYIFIFIS